MAAEQTAGDRLFELRDRAGLSLREAAARSGLSYGHIREIEKLPGKAENMTASTMRGLAVAYGVTVEQIVRIATGRPMPVTSEPVEVVHGSGPRRLVGGLIFVPVMGSANGGRPTEYGVLPVKPSMVRGDNTRAYEVDGDSMTAADGSGIHDGDWVLVDTSLTAPINGKVFLLEIIGDGMAVKRLRQVGADWLFMSDNPKGESWTQDQVRIVGEVYGKVNFKAIH